jgi:hypothetical protein
MTRQAAQEPPESDESTYHEVSPGEHCYGGS